MLRSFAMHCRLFTFKLVLIYSKFCSKLYSLFFITFLHIMHACEQGLCVWSTLASMTLDQKLKFTSIIKDQSTPINRLGAVCKAL